MSGKVMMLLTAMIGWFAASANADSEQDYFAIFFEGQKIGYGVSERIEDQGKIITSDQIDVTIKRDKIPLKIRVVEKSIETPDGRAIGFESVQDLSLMSMTMKGAVDQANQVEVTIESGGLIRHDRFKWPEDALLHEGVRQLTEKQGLAEGTSYTIKEFFPSYLKAFECRLVVGPTEPVDLLGRVVPLTRIDVTYHLPGTQIPGVLYVDGQFKTLKLIQQIGDLAVEMIACDRQFALSENDVPDFIDQMLIHCPVPAGDLKEAASAKYHLETEDKAEWSFPDDDNQTVTPDGRGGVWITVRPLRAESGSTLPYTGSNQAVLETLKPNRYLQSDSEAVRAAAREAIGSTVDAAEAVKKIEMFVKNYIQQKSLNIGYACATEILQSRQGDCSEHAVLTAALCQAVGIPARVAVGYVYAEQFGDHRNIFGGHAWTEAYINGKWIGLDATRAPNGYSAGHLKLQSGGGKPEDFFTLIGMQTRFRITGIIVNDLP